MKNDYDRSIEMICPVCGGKTFHYDNEIENGNVTCIQCKKEFTRDELREANQENISVNLDEIKKEVMDDITADLRKMLKKNKFFG